MAAAKKNRSSSLKIRLAECMQALSDLQFGARQRNEVAAYTLLAILDLRPDVAWVAAQAPLMGITPIIDFIAANYSVRYAPNTRETIRDEAVKFFVESGLVLRNPDNPDRPTNSGNTVYQIEPTALALLRQFGTASWPDSLQAYLASRESIRDEISRKRHLARVPVTLPDGSKVALSPGGQNPLIKAVIERFCPAFAHGGIVIYIGDTENKFVHLEAAALGALGVSLLSSAVSGVPPETLLQLAGLVGGTPTRATGTVALPFSRRMDARNGHAALHPRPIRPNQGCNRVQ